MDNSNNGQQIQPAEPMQVQQPSVGGSNTGTILCIISLICKLAAPVAAGIAVFILDYIDGSTVIDVINSIVYLLVGAADIAAWVLVIVARVKYKNTFSLVLLIIYLVLLALFVIGTIILVVACISWLQSCQID